MEADPQHVFSRWADDDAHADLSSSGVSPDDFGSDGFTPPVNQLSQTVFLRQLSAPPGALPMAPGRATSLSGLVFSTFRAHSRVLAPAPLQGGPTRRAVVMTPGHLAPVTARAETHDQDDGKEDAKDDPVDHGPPLAVALRVTLLQRRSCGSGISRVLYDVAPYPSASALAARWSASIQSSSLYSQATPPVRPKIVIHLFVVLATNCFRDVSTTVASIVGLRHWKLAVGRIRLEYWGHCANLPIFQSIQWWRLG